ncbi:MAG TPA: DMT family transporter [Hyphomicrobiaceae bacterium]|nr:DMT family transporter [Hyphomicrobiaceae bacterium]
MTPPPKPLDRQDWTLLWFLSLLWGGAFFFAGVAVRELPPLTCVLIRVALAAVTLLPIFWALGFAVPRSPAGWLPFLGMALFNNVLPFALIFAGQTFITVGLSSIINALTPLITLMVMAAFQQERLTVQRSVGVALGAAGVAILHGFDGVPDGAQTLGIGLCLAGALSYGFAALWGRRYLAGVPPLLSATCQLICSTLIMLPVVALSDRPWTLNAPSGTTLLALLALAVLGTAVAYLVFFHLFVRAGASNVMLVTLLIPMTAVLLGNIFLGEPLRPAEITGAMVIGLGLLFIDGRALRGLTGRRAGAG